MTYLVSIPGCRLIQSHDRYIRVEFTDSRSHRVDDAEFYFTPNDSIIQFKCERRSAAAYSSPPYLALPDSKVYKKRINGIRRAMEYEAIPVLRNRRRAFLFGESSLDTFGPPTIGFERTIDHISSDAPDAGGLFGNRPGVSGPMFSSRYPG